MADRGAKIDLQLIAQTVLFFYEVLLRAQRRNIHIAFGPQQREKLIQGLRSILLLIGDWERGVAISAQAPKKKRGRKGLRGAFHLKRVAYAHAEALYQLYKRRPRAYLLKCHAQARRAQLVKFAAEKPPEPKDMIVAAVLLDWQATGANALWRLTPSSFKSIHDRLHRNNEDLALLAAELLRWIDEERLPGVRVRGRLRAPDADLELVRGLLRTFVNRASC
jgi:hypothetical protein